MIIAIIHFPCSQSASQAARNCLALVGCFESSFVVLSGIYMAPNCVSFLFVELIPIGLCGASNCECVYS